MFRNGSILSSVVTYFQFSVLEQHRHWHKRRGMGLAQRRFAFVSLLKS